MRWFETRGPVYPENNYVVARTEELADFVSQLEKGRYIVLFAPRQTGKTTLFRKALNSLQTNEQGYIPIHMNFESYVDISVPDFYSYFCADICRKLAEYFQIQKNQSSNEITSFLNNSEMIDHVSIRIFFEQLYSLLRSHHDKQKMILIIDEFDGIPRDAVRGFLHSLRQLYLSGIERCPYSVGIVGVRSITQLNYDRSISPFNIQDEFKLTNFTIEQIQELFDQYIKESGQQIDSEVFEAIHKQSAGQPFLVNRFGQIFTEEMKIPIDEPITMDHFLGALSQLRREQNTNISHLTTNIRRDRRYERLLMKITSFDDGVEYSLHNELISELTTYGVIAEDVDGMCKIVNPIYHYCILQTFKPIINGLEQDYLPDDTLDGFNDYLSSDGQLKMDALIDNFNDFIKRVGFRILQVPETPKEYVGQYLLFAYLSQFVNLIGGTMFLEVQTGRGRLDLIILHQSNKYIVETKIWGGDTRYQAGKTRLANYVKLENATAGYYVVFDHRKTPKPLIESEIIDEITIQSYVIPVIQEQPSSDKR
ncbi:AAA-like domain-containing protein [Candidatus Poribacteria bacterium]|nr:AAA-like domain-containing protein [Candidatus Poribacteria bacterium]